MCFRNLAEKVGRYDCLHLEQKFVVLISPYFTQQMCKCLQISNRHGSSYVRALQRRERSLGEVCSVPGRLDEDDVTGLMWALLKRHNAIVRLLLHQARLDLNCTSVSSNTALHFSAKVGSWISRAEIECRHAGWQC